MAKITPRDLFNPPPQAAPGVLVQDHPAMSADVRAFVDLFKAECLSLKQWRERRRTIYKAIYMGATTWSS